MTPADRRVTELIDKWLASIELHLKYVELSDAAYARAQTWPKHDRPTRWVLEVARQKALELKAHCETRQAMGDSRFSESLELMSFLANLVGIQHIQRFIPLAEPARADQGSSASVAVVPTPSASHAVHAPSVARPMPQRARPAVNETTQEVPRLKPAAPAKPGPEVKTRTDGPKPPARAVPARPTAPAKAISEELKNKIIADAIRLLKWGKSWHELGDLIARIADRPPAAEIRKVLRTNKSEIEQRAQA